MQKDLLSDTANESWRTSDRDVIAEDLDARASKWKNISKSSMHPTNSCVEHLPCTFQTLAPLSEIQTLYNGLCASPFPFSSSLATFFLIHYTPATLTFRRFLALAKISPTQGLCT